MGFKQILVAIDPLPLSVKVFDQALELAQKEGARLMIFHCFSNQVAGDTATLIDAGTGMSLYPSGLGSLQQLDYENLQRETKQVETWLETFWQKATDQGVPAEFDYKAGDPGVQICDLARSWSADLIVIGRRGHTGLAEMLLGSVSNHVIHHASCSVLVVQEES